jgi:nitroreductase
MASPSATIAAMSLLTVARQRYSCRAFLPDAVGEEPLGRVLEAARLAPTACNRQPFKLLVLDTARYQSQLRRIYRREWFVQAPLVVAVLAAPHLAWVRHDGVNYAVVDATIAFDHLILAASDEGLGTCWVAAFDVPAARECLQLSPQWEPVAFTPLGWPADKAPTKERRPIDDLVQYGLP